MNVKNYSINKIDVKGRVLKVGAPSGGWCGGGGGSERCSYSGSYFISQLAGEGRLLGTLDLGLHLYASSTTSLVGYTDADWASCPSTRSAEAEYRGVANVYVAETCMACNLFVLEFSTCALSFPLNIANFHQGWLRIFEEFRSSLSVRPPPAPTTEAY
ncbi:hypothetical protein Tco_0004933 [Tanacetum coccineum]